MLGCMTAEAGGDDRSEGVYPPLWDARFGEPPWDLEIGKRVWELHLALAEANSADPALYSAGIESAAFIRELAQHREEEIALQLILTCAIAPAPSLVEQARRVARVLFERYPDSAAKDADAFVEVWLGWDPESSAPPPYTT